MKGVLYDIKLKVPKSEEFIEGAGKNMFQTIDMIKEYLRDEYGIYDINITRHVVYNLIHRPRNANKILRNNVTVSKSIS